MTQDENSLTVTFDPQSMATVRKLAQRLAKRPEELIGEALVLLQLAQGRKVILKDKDKAETFEVRNWENQPVLTPVKP